MTASPQSALPTRPFGKTDLLVTSLCIGCAQLGDMPDTFAFSVSEQQALETHGDDFDLKHLQLELVTLGDTARDLRARSIVWARDHPQHVVPGVQILQRNGRPMLECVP